MKKRIRKQILGLACCLAIFLSYIPDVQAEENITPSTVEYEVEIVNSNQVFIGNDKAVEWKEGRKYFLTYTVGEVTENEKTQSGIVVTTDRENAYPYTKGGMWYERSNLLCQEGYTYFLRFEVTKEGLECIVAKGKETESSYVTFSLSFGDLKTVGTHFGAWMAEGGKISAKLSHVRCYDEKGNDLGVYGNKKYGVTVFQTSGMAENKSVDHHYSFSLKEANRIAVSNLRPTDSSVVFMEYTVKNVKAENVTQSGGVITKNPTAVYPFQGVSGQLNYTAYKEAEECDMLTEGAHYLLRFERDADSFEVLVKRTLNGKTDYIIHSNYYGVYSNNSRYVSVWFGEDCSLTADFEDVKCYDSKGKNLAIQTNKGAAITHYGKLEDYSACAAVYYCKANNTFITLDDECNAGRKVDGETESVMGTYYIREAVLTLNIGEEAQNFDYTYRALVDEDKNTYIRMKDSEVVLMTKAVDGEMIKTVSVTAADGYKLSQPDDPTREGQTFLYWVKGDGKEYNFEEVVTESMTLYAVWDGEEAYKETGIPVVKEDIRPVVIVAVICVLLVTVTVSGIVWLSRRKKHEKSGWQKKGE